MTNYKQNDITGTEWQRCQLVSISNPLSGPKYALFSEERVASTGTWSVTKEVPGCRKAFAPDGTFPLLDPTTNLPTGTSMTHTDLYVALYSLYMQTAMERDSNF
jgi:hypothetical protein